MSLCFCAALGMPMRVLGLLGVLLTPSTPDDNVVKSTAREGKQHCHWGEKGEPASNLVTETALAAPASKKARLAVGQEEIRLADTAIFC